MKKTIRVTIEKEYEVEINDDILTQEFVDEFESYMWELDADTLDSKRVNLLEFAARQIAEYDVDFVEGLGKCASVRTAPFHEKNGEKVSVVWNDTYSSVETEVVE